MFGKISLLAALTSAWPALALVTVAPPAGEGSQVEYRLVGGQIDFRWAHPFRVLHGTTRSMTGKFVVDAENPGEGMRMALEFPLAAIDASDSPLVDFLGGRFNEASPALKFEARAARIPDDVKRLQKLTLFGDASYGALTRSVELAMQCSPEVEYVRCTFETTVRPSLFSTEAPQRLKLRAEDKIAVSGELTFGPQKED